LNNLKVRNEKLSVEVKQKMYEELFERGKKVSKKSIINYLKGCGILQDGAEDELTGMMDSINSSLSSYGKFKAIFGDQMQEDSCKKMVEKIIFWCTVYGDSRHFLKEQLEENYGDILTKEQIKRILGFKFKDWGNLSKSFLELYGCRKDTGEAMSLIRMMWETNDNLMELLAKDKYTYSSELEGLQEKLEKSLAEIRPEDLEGYYFSAPVKRMIWQTVLVLREIEKVMGQPPKRLFVEMTREDGEKNVMKDSRTKKFIELYKNIKAEDQDWKKVIENAEQSGTIRSKKMYLYLTQRGRCMYTGKPIDLSQLFDNNLYDIDHIYPRHYVKDDNLENNMVLVEKQKNAHKSDNYPLEESIYSKQLPFWKELHHQKLINDEKFRRLTGRDPFTDEQKAGFIARQLVETSQGTKGVASILKEVLLDTTIVYAKARNVSDFRNQYKLLKSRVVNDFHHAQDAYLNIVVGNVYYTKFTNNPINFVKKRESYNLSRVFDWNVVRNEEVAWIAKPENGQKATIDIVRQTMAKNTPLLTRLCFEGSGGLANQTLYSAEKAQGSGYIPLKESDAKLQNVTKYGGFSSISTAYFILVEHDLKKKRVRTLETVSVLWKDRIEKDSTQLKIYCEKVLGLINPDVRVRKIRIQSLVKKDGYYMYLSGKTGNQITMRNAVQLCLQQDWINYIKKLEKETEDDAVTKEKNCELYDILCEKHNRGIYTRRPNPVGEKLKKRKERFYKLDLGEQKKVILELLNLSKIGVVQANLTLIGETSAAGTMKISKNISEFEEFKLINQSVTGLYEKQVDLLIV
jgi:CRISPR-associated endonuclease Csn1